MWSNDEPIECVWWRDDDDDDCGVGRDGFLRDKTSPGARLLALPISTSKLRDMGGSSQGVCDATEGRGGGGRVTGARQRGHEGDFRIQGSTQPEWKAWRQAGSRRRSSSGPKGRRHTAQSGEDLGRAAREEERLKMGRESISADFTGSELGSAVDVTEAEVERELTRSDAAATEEDEEEERREEKRSRRMRWIDTEATQTQARMAAMMRRLGLKDREEEEEVSDGRWLGSTANGKGWRSSGGDGEGKEGP